MRKSILLFLLLITVLLSACLPQTQASPTVTQVKTPTARALAELAVVTVPAQSAVLPDAGCTVVTKKPIAGATAESSFPPVTSSDWVKGPSDAKVTIIEYSDFQ